MKETNKFTRILKKVWKWVMSINMWLLLLLFGLLPLIMSFCFTAWWLLFYTCYILAICEWQSRYIITKRHKERL